MIKKSNKALLFTWISVISVFFWTSTAQAQWTWWGFFDIDYSFSPSDSVGALENGAFSIGQFDMFTSYNMDDRIEVLAELVFEAPEGDVLVDLERVLVSYTFADAFTVEAGRGHTPLGYYSNTFHHGRQLESAIGRPLILEFEDEGGLIPAHIVGMWARGFFSGDAGTAEYHLGIINGQKLDADNGELSLNLGSDDDKNKTVIGKINLEPTALGGFAFGGSFSIGKMNGFSEFAANPATPVIQLDQTTLGLHAYYDILPVQFIGEFYSISSKDKLAAGTPTFTSTGFFVQGAYEFQQKYRPYARYEKVSPEKGDPYTSTLFGSEDVERFTAGFRFNISEQSSIKIQGISQQTGNADRITILGAQWSVVF